MSKTRKTRYVVLGLLTHERMTGYDIKKIVETQLSFFWSESYGQIYPALAELEEEGLISLEEETGAVPRKVYAIRDAGRQELQNWLKTPVEEEKIRYELLLRTFLGNPDDPQTLYKQLHDFRRRQKAQLSILWEFEQSLRAAQGDNPQHLNYLLTVLCGKRVHQAFFDWSEEAIALLQEREKGERE